jgi:hypothetical protein
MSGDTKFNYTYLTRNLSATLIIPIDIVRKHGLDNPTEVVVKETEDGVLITRNEVDKSVDGKIHRIIA